MVHMAGVCVCSTPLFSRIKTLITGAHPEYTRTLAFCSIHSPSIITMFVIAAFIALAAARQPGPPNDEGDSASSSSSDSLHNNVDVPHRIHRWPVPGAPAMRALVPRPRAVEVLGGAFTSGPIRNITVVDVTSVASVSGSPLKIQCEADRAWLAETLLRARESMQGISSVGGASTPSHVDRDDVYANVDAVDVRLTLLADGDVLPAAVHDEHGEIAGPEAYELTLHSGVLSIAGKRWDTPRTRRTLVFSAVLDCSFWLCSHIRCRTLMHTLTVALVCSSPRTLSCIS